MGWHDRQWDWKRGEKICDSGFGLSGGDDLEMPMDVWLMGSVLKIRRQDYVYINRLLDIETVDESRLF